MSISRKDKRKYQRLVDTLQQKFGATSEEFASSYLSAIAGGEDKDQIVDLVDRYDKNWREFVRVQLDKYPKVRDDSDKRKKILERFIMFVGKFIERTHQQSDIKGDPLSTGEVGIEKMKEALKEIGVITQAKTMSGVQKRVDDLDQEQSVRLIKVIQREL